MAGPHPNKRIPNTVIGNIDAVVEMEEKAARERPRLDRWADAIGGFVGTVAFVAVHLAGFALWVLVNTGVLPVMAPFDPFPFALLAVIVSLESVLLTTFVLITQNRMGERADHRAHLDLQINLLTEREVTKLIHMLDRVTARLGVQDAREEAEISEMSRETAVSQLSAKFEARATDVQTPDNSA